MHISGKILAALTIIAGLAAPVLTAKLIQVRNGWTRKATKLTADYERVIGEKEKLQGQLDVTRAELARTLAPWNLTFNKINTAITAAAEGKVTIELGTEVGLKEKQWLYGFEMQPDGSSIYRGVFEITGVRERQALLKPRWRTRKPDLAGWKGGEWRWRTVVPDGYVKRFTDLELLLLKADELLADRQGRLTDVEAMFEESEEQLKFRVAELIGNPELLPQAATLPTENRSGLVAALEEEAAVRDAALAEIDGLRRDLRKLAKEIDAIDAQNRELAAKLPRPAVGTASRQP